MKKALVWLVTVITLFLLCVTVGADDVVRSVTTAVDVSTATDVTEAGTKLLETLLTRQFEAFMKGEQVDTSDIFVDSESTALYDEYLYWYLNKTWKTGRNWAKYEYTLEFAEKEGNTLSFLVDLDFWREGHDLPSQQHNFQYVIGLTEMDGRYYISEIDTEEVNYHDFVDCYDEIAAMTETVTTLSTGEQKSVADAMIDNAVRLYGEMDSIVVDPADVVDLDDNEAVSIATCGFENATTYATTVTYNGNNGRVYADTYAVTANPNFVEFAGADCTNFVSQCIWAAYGGWTSDDDNDTMADNIANGVCMQSSTSSDNWYARSNGCGNPWSGVANLWTFVVNNTSTGPKGTGHNDGGIHTNIHPSSILTGQVLQFKKPNGTVYEHSVYVAGGVNDAYSNIRIAQHSTNAIRYLDDSIYYFSAQMAHIRIAICDKSSFKVRIFNVSCLSIL